MQTNGFGFVVVVLPAVMIFAATAGVPKLSAVLAALINVLR